jgi:hypothetical protein
MRPRPKLGCGAKGRGKKKNKKKMREEVTRRCRGLRHEHLHNLYASPNIIRLVKSRRM